MHVAIQDWVGGYPFEVAGPKKFSFLPRSRFYSSRTCANVGEQTRLQPVCIRTPDCAPKSEQRNVSGKRSPSVAEGLHSYAGSNIWKNNLLTSRALAIGNECGGIPHPYVSFPRAATTIFGSRKFCESLVTPGSQ